MDIQLPLVHEELNQPTYSNAKTACTANECMHENNVQKKQLV